ncbi:nucleotidyltransferase family protein [archaeon]|nr:nucleotidyltransferase family protein [archaeon]
MKAMILAAGLGETLYPITRERAKPLLPIKGKPMLNHLLESLKNVPLKSVCIVTNAKFYDEYVEWKKESGFDVEIVNNGSFEEKGAVYDINLAIEKCCIDDDLMIFAGGHMVDFSLREFYNIFKGKSVVALSDYEDKMLIAGRLGCVLLDDGKIVNFEEKPEDPKSSLVATACYIVAKNDVGKLKSVKGDKLGDVVGHLVKNSEVRGYIMKGRWFYVGNVDQYSYLKNNF